MLFFDTWEQSAQYLDGWLLNLLDEEFGPVPANVVVVLAGRDELTELASRGVSGPGVVEAVLQLSMGLPLLVELPLSGLNLRTDKGTGRLLDHQGRGRAHVPITMAGLTALQAWSRIGHRAHRALSGRRPPSPWPHRPSFTLPQVRHAARGEGSHPPTASTGVILRSFADRKRPDTCDLELRFD
ncbi:hypothetical protein [Streptomyces sp. CA-251251]|uniref:hypothetical protein n=1 Tax=Streptomyces sp. CA-251251 TaxID=3240063 RepID=UPI003D8C8078